MRWFTVLLLAFLIGRWSGGFLPSAQAAPGDVFGSPNVAIDTYRNSRGTYVLWSDGRITSAQGGAQDLGHPYRAPEAAARIGPPSHSQGRPMGSPNVAVKAIPRPDATYVLFSDGNLRRPAHADAAAGGSGGSRVLHIPASVSLSQPFPPNLWLEVGDTEDFRSVSPGGVELAEPVSANATGFATIKSSAAGSEGTWVLPCIVEDGKRVSLRSTSNIPGGATVHIVLVDR